jgi:hypothetical protein
MFLVERVPQTTDMPRLDPQSFAELFQGSDIVNVVHAETPTPIHARQRKG